MKIDIGVVITSTIRAVEQHILQARANAGSASLISRIDENLRQLYDSAIAIGENTTGLYPLVQPHAG